MRDMTIADAFNDITVAKGGTPDTSGTIAGAIDKLVDTLAGEDVPERATIEESVAVLGEYIGGGSGVTYAFTSSGATSINGGAAVIYGTEEPAGTVTPGDVITWDGGGGAVIVYVDQPNRTPILEKQATSPYTVEAVDGATQLYVNNAVS